MSENLKIGSLITEPQDRDAIHIAVYPATVAFGEQLLPGARVKVRDGEVESVSKSEPCDGIIDPFLKVKVRQGDVVWVFMNPGSITSLRHDWTHPAIKDNPEVDQIKASREWLDKWYSENYTSEEQIIRAINNDGHLNDEDLHASPNVDFWYHFKIVHNYSGPTYNYFSCSC